MSKVIRLIHRSVITLRGSDSLNLLQGLVTNDVGTVNPSQGIAAFFLNTQGRIADDVIISRDNGDILVECTASNLKELKKMLEKYRMRKHVEIIDSHQHVLYSEGEAEGSIPDPRCPSLGRRIYGDPTENTDASAYHQRRMEHGIAEGCEELAGRLPFHANGDLLPMISFSKGCYIGQELTARTAHTGVIRRRILPFKCEKKVSGHLMQDDKKVGEVVTCGSNVGLALISLSAFGRAFCSSDGTPVRPYKPAWMPESALKPKEKS